METTTLYQMKFWKHVHTEKKPQEKNVNCNNIPASLLTNVWRVFEKKVSHAEQTIKLQNIR